MNEMGKNIYYTICLKSFSGLHLFIVGNAYEEWSCFIPATLRYKDILYIRIIITKQFLCTTAAQ